MSSFTKAHAKMAVEQIGSLLQDRMMIGEITRTLVRGNIEYQFITCGRVPLEIKCKDVKELSTALTCMWEGYVRAREALGFDDTYYDDSIY